MKIKLWHIFVTALVFRLVLSFLTWHPDLNNHIDWGIRFFEYGAAKVYAPESNVWSFTWPNQPPGTMLIFAGVRKAFEFVFNIFWQINIKIPAFPSIIITFFEDTLYASMLKWPAILADLGIAFLIYRFFADNKKQNLGKIGAIIFLVNPVIWYNSSLWGQYDSVINFLALLSFYLLFKKKYTLSFLAFALSLYTKISLVIFLPVYLIVLFKQKIKVTELVKAGVISLLAITLVTIPFARGNPLVWLYNLYTKKILVNQLHLITANAFNIWATLTGIHERPNSLKFGPLSFNQWGAILFLAFFIPAVVVFIKKKKITNQDTLAMLAVTAFGVFMLMTNMHERYLYPLFPVMTILAVKREKLRGMYWAVSGISLLNLYNFWWFPRIDVLVNFMSFGDRLMPRFLGVVMFFLFLETYKLLFRQLKAT